MAIKGFGTTLKKGSTAIGEITSIKGPALSADVIDITTMDDVTEGYRKYVGNLKDGGEVEIEGFLDAGDTGQSALVTDLGATAAEYTITFPGGANWTFNAVVTAFETDATLEDAVGFSAKFKVSGKPILANA